MIKPRPALFGGISKPTSLALGAALGPELNKRCRRELKPTNGSWRVDETYICQGGSWRYLYRAVDSSGATIDFWFSAERGGGSQAVLPESLTGSWSSPAAGHHRRRQPVLPLSNLPVFVVEQDHRGVKRRVNASQGFRSFDGGWRTIQGYEILHMSERPRGKWLSFASGRSI